MKLGYFPGCSLHATAREYEESLRSISGLLDIQLEEIEDWACCGATSAHSISHSLSIALPARTLMLAQKQKLDRVFAPCAACYNRLAGARHELMHVKESAERIQKLLDYGFENPVDVVSVAQLLSESADEIRKKAKTPLKDVRVACYYGCLLVRPPKICRFDDAEIPSSLERIASATGATPVKWDMALECCGGGFSLSRTASVVRLSRAILDSARRAGAQAVVVACPMCHSNLDFRQAAINRRSHSAEKMPILFVSQLVGLSAGLNPAQLGLERHFVSAQPLLNQISAARSQQNLREQA
jgi:heterodisulfide reductase subunit B